MLFQRPHSTDEMRDLTIVSVAVAAPLDGVVLRVSERAGRTIVLHVTPGSRPEPLALNWDPAFRERFQVGGAPSAVLREWFTACVAGDAGG